MSNIKIGNSTEKNCCSLLSMQGWWCHRMVASDAGQPCDIVALKAHDCMLIDAKHCDVPYLRTSRIEPNQASCFRFASERYGIKCGFMCEYNEKLYWLDWKDVDLMKTSQRFNIKKPLDPFGAIE